MSTTSSSTSNQSADATAANREPAGAVPYYDHRGAGMGRPTPSVRSRRTAGQIGTVAVLVVALLFSGVTRYFAMRFQDTHSPRGSRSVVSRSSLAGMDTYALALLLGGLRGPLVMVLWAQSEAQKADRDLEGINTQIDWIRRLQPEFDTVHVFQMWNKAYNLSVQMVGLSNKYTTILDAADYGWSIDAERPDNLNIIKELGRVYGDKLGSSNPEKHYYRERLRKETKWREPSGTTSGAQRGDPGFQRLAHDPLLDASGNILPKYLQPRVSYGPYDGSPLQFLKQYEPFPYGVSPLALGYNFNKRAQLLMEHTGQKPTQVSESVIDAQPGLSLKLWAEEEWERGRRMEAKAFGEKVAYERLDLELPTADKPVAGGFKDASDVPEMIYCYDQTVRLVDDSTKEYKRHLASPDYAGKVTLYASHLDQMQGMRWMAVGDRDYLKAMQAPAGPERAALLASAAQGYRNSIRDFGLTCLRYFTGDTLAAAVMPPGVNRTNVGTGAMGSKTAVTDVDVLRMMNGIRQILSGPNAVDENYEDRKEYETYITRATERLQQIEQASK